MTPENLIVFLLVLRQATGVSCIVPSEGRSCNLAQPCEKKDHLDKITAAVLVWSTYNTSRSSNMLAGFIYVMVEHVDHDFIKS